MAFSAEACRRAGAEGRRWNLPCLIFRLAFHALPPGIPAPLLRAGSLPLYGAVTFYRQLREGEFARLAFAGLPFQASMLLLHASAEECRSETRDYLLVLSDATSAGRHASDAAAGWRVFAARRFGPADGPDEFGCDV